ncbi:MAG: phosphatase PAP2 family protein [Oscillospiraceae bacterium]|nr:phosphatase PAP2 family protein [bacterium]MDY5100354.1 phosphatase PAP2 family protein [Oscillospiraceae bacterium]
MELTAAASWLNTVFASFDLSVAQGVHVLYEALPWLFTPLLSFVTLLASPAGSICISLFLALWPRTRRFGMAMLMGIIVGALMTNVILKPLVLRPRPYSWDGSVYQEYWHLLGEPMESDYSFPSGHTTAAFAMAWGVTASRDKRKIWVAFILAFLIALSRIYLSVHYATDVLVGLILGTIGGNCGVFLSRKLPEAVYTYGLPLPKSLGNGGGKHLRK